jgi:hypothetical protein
MNMFGVPKYTVNSAWHESYVYENLPLKYITAESKSGIMYFEQDEN